MTVVELIVDMYAACDTQASGSCREEGREERRKREEEMVEGRGGRMIVTARHCVPKRMEKVKMNIVS